MHEAQLALRVGHAAEPVDVGGVRTGRAMRGPSPASNSRPRPIASGSSGCRRTGSPRRAGSARAAAASLRTRARVSYTGRENSRHARASRDTPAGNGRPGASSRPACVDVGSRSSARSSRSLASVGLNRESRRAEDVRDRRLDRERGRARIGGVADRPADDDVVRAVREMPARRRPSLLVVDRLVVDRPDAGRDDQQP